MRTGLRNHQSLNSLNTNPALICVGFVTLFLVSCSLPKQTGLTDQKMESMEIIAFNTRFNYDILNLITTNQIEKAQTRLQTTIFMDLLHLWEIGGTGGVLSNQGCNEAFTSIYPSLREQVSLDRFENILPSMRTNLMRFVSEMDAALLNNK